MLSASTWWDVTIAAADAAGCVGCAIYPYRNICIVRSSWFRHITKPDEPTSLLSLSLSFSLSLSLSRLQSAYLCQDVGCCCSSVYISQNHNIINGDGLDVRSISMNVWRKWDCLSLVRNVENTDQTGM